MNLQKMGVVLLALLLAGMAMVPMVSAAENVVKQIDLIEKNYIAKTDALEAAEAELSWFTENGLLDKEFVDATINPDPVPIYDINGMILYYSFSIEKDNMRVGEVKIAASKVHGAPIISIGKGPKPINHNELNRKAEEILEKENIHADLSSARLVCYEYPKIGLQISGSIDNSAKGRSLVIDAYDYSIIPESELKSYYDSMTIESMESGVRTWEINARRSEDKGAQGKIKRADVGKTLSGFTLYPQEGTNWCSFATAKMISAWHGYYPSQRQIAETVGVDPDDGADETQMRDGYYRKSRSSNGLGKGGSYVLAGSPSNLYDLVKTEIDHNRPVAINTPAHARACAGYSRNVESGNRYFYIYNPWPVGSGDLTWEMWNGLSSGYDSSIFVID